MADIVIPEFRVKSQDLKLIRGDAPIQLMNGAEVIMAPNLAVWGVSGKLPVLQETDARKWRSAAARLSSLGNRCKIKPADYDGPGSGFGSEDARAVRFPGASGDYASTPDRANLRITGDIDIRAKIIPNCINNGWYQTIASKWNTSGQRSWYLYLNKNGQIVLLWSENGVDVSHYEISSIGLSTPNGVSLWVRAVLDADDDAGGYTVTFYTGRENSSNVITWTQLGSVHTGSANTFIAAGSDDLCVGGVFGGTNYLLHGIVQRLIVKDGIDGTTVADFNPSDAIPGDKSWISTSTRETWSLHGNCDLVGLQYSAINTSTDYCSAPDADILDIVNDIDLRGTVNLSTLGPGSYYYPIYKWASGQHSYILGVRSDGNLILYWSEDGSIDKSEHSTVALTTVASANQDIDIRATLDVDNGAGGYEAKFWYSTDGGATWTQLGATITGGATTSVFAGTALLKLGVYGANVPSRLRRAIVCDGILDNQPGKHVNLPGATGDYISAPNSASLDITTDLELQAHICPDDSTSGTPRIIGKWTGPNLSYLMRLNGGKIQFYWSEDGSTSIVQYSDDISALFTANDDLWIRITLDVDNGAGGYDLKFWYSLNGSGWVQIGATITGGATTSIFNGTAEIELGGASTYLNGKLYRAIIKDGIGGTVVADFDPDTDANIGDTTWTGSVDGLTWTVNGNAIITDGRVADFNPTLDANVGDASFPSSLTGETWTVNGAAYIGGYTPLVAGASQLGTSLDCDGVPPNTVVAWDGDFLEANGEFKILTADAISDSTGAVTFNFEPALRSAPADNAAVNIQTPKLNNMRFMDAQAAWTVNAPKLYDMQISAIESFGP